MKKGIASLFLAAVLAIVLGIVAFADDSTIVASGDCGANGDNVTWTLDSDGLLTISGEGEMENYQYGDSMPWYANRSKITKVVISDGVTSIVCEAFIDCSSLTSVTIPDSVTSIGYNAFGSCRSLTSITIPSSVTKIEWGAFSECKRLTNVKIPDGVDSIGSFTFNGCSKLSSISIPDSVTSIGDWAFNDCGKLTSITIPSGLTSIGHEAFSGCSSLTSVKIPNKVTSIGYEAFHGCSSLTSITLPNSMTCIEWGTFDGCSSLTSVSIPSSVIDIGRDAFYGCSKLASVTIPDGVDSIEKYTFAGCSCLTSISIPDSVTSIEERAFSRCSSLTSVKISNGVTDIGDSAFYNCSSLTSVTIPDSIESIGTDAFFFCDSLDAVYFGGTEAQWLNVSIEQGNGCVQSADKYFAGGKFVALTAVPDYLTSTGKPYIKWKAVDGAAKYEVYRSTNETRSFQLLETTTKPNYTDTTAELGCDYYYKVRPVGIKSAAGNMSAPVRATCRCGKPKMNKAQYLTASGKPYLTWPAVDGASKYQVYRAASKNGTYKLLGTTTGMSYTDASAYAGYTYYYKIKAVCMGNSAATSAYSATVSAVSHCARPVAKPDYLTSTGKPYVKWSAVTGASKYQVYRSTSKTGTYKLLGTTTKLNYTDTTATTGYTYYYKVKAVSKVKTSANSAYSTPISIICHCAKPVVKITTTSSGDPKLTWRTVTGASKYEVYRATSRSGTYTKVATTTAKTYTNKTAKSGKTYYYKVKAVSKVKTSANSAYSAVKSIKAR